MKKIEYDRTKTTMELHHAQAIYDLLAEIASRESGYKVTAIVREKTPEELAQSII